MQSTAYPLSIQPPLFTSEDLSPCFFFQPTEDELRYMEIWENLVSAMPAPVRCDGGRSRTGSVLAIHAVKIFFRLKTLTAARERLLSSSNLRTITGTGRVPSLAVISKKTDELIRIVDFGAIIASICSSFYDGRLVCHLSIDSTTVESREKPVKAESRSRGTGKENSLNDCS